MSPDRVQAPFGRRAVPVSARATHGPYVVISVADPVGPRPQAGQFYMLAATERWGGGEAERPFLPRAFSVLRAPEASDRLDFLLHDVGPGTKRLCELVPGDGLFLLGPLGRPFATPAREGRHAILVGGGVGIAPLAILGDQLEALARVRPPGRTRQAGEAGLATLLGFRDAHHVESAGLLSAAQIATDDGSIGHSGLVTELLERELHRQPHAEVYACGPPAMLEVVRKLCAEHEVPGQLALESGMACGYGACFGCVVATRDGYVRLCVDGPVLDADALDSVIGTVSPAWRVRPGGRTRRAPA